jgi:hypothetical protein
VDFFDCFVEFKGESHQVHALEVAVFFEKDGPRRVRHQVHFVPLVISVARAARMRQGRSLKYTCATSGYAFWLCSTA